MSVRFLDMEFWEKVYLAAIQAGKNPDDAETIADRAVIHWQRENKRRWEEYRNDQA